MGFAKEDPYPCFILESSQPGIPEADLTSSHQILSFLRENNMIGDHKAHSASETQTMDLIENDLAPVLRQMMLPLRAKFQFYSVPRHFKKVELKREVGDFAGQYFWKFVKLVHFYRKDRKEIFETLYSKLELIDKTHKIFDEWAKRLNG